jgi:hypothetical protein
VFVGEAGFSHAEFTIENACWIDFTAMSARLSSTVTSSGSATAAVDRMTNQRTAPALTITVSTSQLFSNIYLIQW